MERLDRWVLRKSNGKETTMAGKRDKEPVVPVDKQEAPASDDYRASASRVMETELGNAVTDEIRTAARELVEEQRLAIREAVEEHKRAIRDALEQEKLSIRAKKEELRESIVRSGMG